MSTRLELGALIESNIEQIKLVILILLLKLVVGVNTGTNSAVKCREYSHLSYFDV